MSNDEHENEKDYIHAPIYELLNGKWQIFDQASQAVEKMGLTTPGEIKNPAVQLLITAFNRETIEYQYPNFVSIFLAKYLAMNDLEISEASIAAFRQDFFGG